jgi:predicted Holliday junction resolvase-like endonuclease
VTWALVSLSFLLLALLVPTAVWLHAEISEGKHLRDLYEEQVHVAARYMGERDLEVAAHAVTTDELKKERSLRSQAEAQRNDALRRARELLVKHMGEATDEEIAAAMADLFAGFSGGGGGTGGVPHVPKADRPSASDTDLEKP